MAPSSISLTMFQSAPPTEVRGDRTKAKPLEICWEFQSAPPTEVRGDHFHTPAPARSKFVSIRSPYRSEGRCWLQQPA